MSSVGVRNFQPRMWAMERERGVAGPVTLRLGTHRFRLDDVCRFEVFAREDRDRHGRFLAFIGFAIAGMIYTIGVVEFGWRHNMLLAAVILLVLSLMSLSELWSQSIKRHITFQVCLRSGEIVVFTTHDDNDAAALQAALTSRI